MKRVAIVGGGITGLAAAYHLERQTDAKIDLYEAGPTVGGKLQTDVQDGLTIERGPDCFFSRKPGAMELVRDLGLQDQLIAPCQKEFSMLVEGVLHKVPGGLVTLTYSEPTAIHEATFLSPAARARVLAEADQPAGTAPDESIRSFFTRRFGEEFTRVVAEPLLAGTHGGDPDRLSMRALYPGYFDLERRHGSLSAGMTAPKERPSERTPSFLSFRGGMRALVDALVAALSRTQIRVNAGVESLDEIDADQILVAVPASRAASLLPPAERLLRQIEHRSSTIVTFAFARAQIGHPLDGTGFLVPPSDQSPLTGATWSSEKWPSRAPAGTVLMRVFARGSTVVPETLLDALRPLLSITGEPSLTQIDRWDAALPQYEVGHLDRIAEIEAALHVLPKVSLAGTSYRGVGIPDCLRQGREAAATIAERL